MVVLLSVVDEAYQGHIKHAQQPNAQPVRKNTMVSRCSSKAVVTDAF